MKIESIKYLKFIIFNFCFSYPLAFLKIIDDDKSQTSAILSHNLDNAVPGREFPYGVLFTAHI
jgi:hypothetical protein